MTKIYSVFKNGPFDFKTGKTGKSTELYTSANKAQTMKVLRQRSIKDLQAMFPKQDYSKNIKFSTDNNRYELPFSNVSVFSNYYLQTGEQK